MNAWTHSQIARKDSENRLNYCPFILQLGGPYLETRDELLLSIDEWNFNPQNTIISKQTFLHVSTKFCERLCLDLIRPIVPEFYLTSSLKSALNRNRHLFPCIMLALKQSSTVNSRKSIYVGSYRMNSRVESVHIIQCSNLFREIFGIPRKWYHSFFTLE